MKISKIFFPSCILFLSIVLIHIVICIRENGSLVYPLDDAYIHLAIAKNFSAHLVWGINPGEFVSASSSPLYTLVLSFCIFIFGYSLWIPLLLNILICLILLLFTTKIIIQFLNEGQSRTYVFALILFIPLPGICLAGMEHSLQLLFCTAFVYYTWKFLNNRKINLFLYAMIAMLSVITRYEDIFLVGWVAVSILLVQKKWKISSLLLASALLPVVVFGFFSIWHGGGFLPNSLLKKSSATSGTLMNFALEVFKKFTHETIIYSLLFLLALFSITCLANNRNKLAEKPVLQINIILALALLSHAVFAAFGWFFRYEAYLICIILLACSFNFQSLAKLVRDYVKGANYIIAVLFFLIILFPLFSRIYSYGVTNKAMRNIHDQQIQLATFIKQYYPGTAVAVNDIGAIALLSNVYVFDVIGLANEDLLKNRNNLSAALFDSLTKKKNVQIAMVYEAWLGDRIPASWVKVGDWTLTDNYICGSPKVSIFAVDTSSNFKETMIRNLKLFGKQMPSGVIQSGTYTNDLIVH